MYAMNVYNEIFLYALLDYPDVHGRNGVIKDTKNRQVFKGFNGEWEWEYHLGSDWTR